MNANWKAQVLILAIAFSFGAKCQEDSEFNSLPKNAKTIFYMKKTIINVEVHQAPEESVDVENKVATKLNAKDENAIWCDSGHACPDDMTCCFLTSGDWGCCPFPYAVCCPYDRCCPYGTVCSSVPGKCIGWKGASMPWSNKIKALKKKPALLLPALNIQDTASYEEE